MDFDFDLSLPTDDPRSIHEIWRDIPGYEGRYQVSNHGQIKSLGRYVKLRGGKLHWRPEQMLVRKLNGNSLIWVVGLYTNGKSKQVMVGYTVLEVFGSPRPGNAGLRYRDGDYDNLHFRNLEWAEPIKNIPFTEEKRQHIIATLETGISIHKASKLCGVSYAVAHKINRRRIAAQQDNR